MIRKVGVSSQGNDGLTTWLQGSCQQLQIPRFVLFSTTSFRAESRDTAGRNKHGLIYIAPKFTMVNTKVLLKLFYSQAQQQPECKHFKKKKKKKKKIGEHVKTYW